MRGKGEAPEVEGVSYGLDAATAGLLAAGAEGVADEGDEERDEAVAEHGEGEREVEGEVAGEGEEEVEAGCCSAGEVEDCLGRLLGEEEEPRRGNLRFLNAGNK